MAQQRYKPEQIIQALHSSRGLVSPAARMLGCDDDTVRNYVKRYVSVAQALEVERDRFLDRAESALMTKVDEGDWQAVAFTLRTLGQKRGYIDKQSVEHSGEVHIRRLIGVPLDEL